MTLMQILELMHDVAYVTGNRVSLGIQVRPNGSGRTTPGTVDDGTEIIDCKFGPGKAEWESSLEGTDVLAEFLREKLAAIRTATPGQTVIFGDE